jgi:6-pyruvoyltetrahydropterin/6-carboxytetrahydropterin synthase
MEIEIDLSKERMKFSSGHFTIFSATERENLHGHNFGVAAAFKAEVGTNGLAVDYGLLKDALMKVCDSLDEFLLLPLHSPHLKIEERDGLVHVQFAQERLQFLPRDVKLLPIRNITVEDLSVWFVDTLRGSLPAQIAMLVRELSVRISSGPGQGATARWSRSVTP